MVTTVQPVTAAMFFAAHDVLSSYVYKNGLGRSGSSLPGYHPCHHGLPFYDYRFLTPPNLSLLRSYAAQAVSAAMDTLKTTHMGVTVWNPDDADPETDPLETGFLYTSAIAVYGPDDLADKALDLMGYAWTQNPSRYAREMAGRYIARVASLKPSVVTPALIGLMTTLDYDQQWAAIKGEIPTYWNHLLSDGAQTLAIIGLTRPDAMTPDVLNVLLKSQPQSSAVLSDSPGAKNARKFMKMWDPEKLPLISLQVLADDWSRHPDLEVRMLAAKLLLKVSDQRWGQLSFTPDLIEAVMGWLDVVTPLRQSYQGLGDLAGYAMLFLQQDAKDLLQTQVQGARLLERVASTRAGQVLFPPDAAQKLQHYVAQGADVESDTAAAIRSTLDSLAGRE